MLVFINSSHVRSCFLFGFGLTIGDNYTIIGKLNFTAGGSPLTICSIDRENFFKFLDAYELDEQTTSSSKKYNNAHFVVFLPYHFGLKDCILTGEGKGVLWVDSPIYKVTPETIWAIRAGSKFVAMNNLTTEKFRIDCSDENDDSKVVILAMELADISC